jgi:nitroreductase
MDISNLIKQRRSIRKFGKKKITDRDINKIMDAARWAPSGMNNQPWRFSIIRTDQTRLGLSKLTKYGQIIKNAPLVILVFLSLADSYDRDKDLMAIGASIQNMLLEAHSLGLGTCWLGEILNKKKEVCQMLKLEKKLECMAAIAVGYPAEKIAKGYRKSLRELLVGKDEGGYEE